MTEGAMAMADSTEDATEPTESPSAVLAMDSYDMIRYDMIRYDIARLERTQVHDNQSISIVTKYTVVDMQHQKSKHRFVI